MTKRIAGDRPPMVSSETYRNPRINERLTPDRNGDWNRVVCLASSLNYLEEDMGVAYYLGDYISFTAGHERMGRLCYVIQEVIAKRLAKNSSVKIELPQKSRSLSYFNRKKDGKYGKDIGGKWDRLVCLIQREFPICKDGGVSRGRNLV